MIDPKEQYRDAYHRAKGVFAGHRQACPDCTTGRTCTKRRILQREAQELRLQWFKLSPNAAACDHFEAVYCRAASDSEIEATIAKFEQEAIAAFCELA